MPTERRVLFACDPKFNSFGRAVAPAVVSPAAHSLFGVANIGNGLPDLPFVYGSVAADELLTQDFNLLTNPTMDTGTTEPTGWTEASVGSGDMTRDATGGESSGPGMKLVAGSGSNFAYGVQDIYARPGEILNWTAALKGNGTAAARLRIQNRFNLKYWNGGAWVSSSADLATNATSSFVTSSGQLTVEDWATLLWPELGYVPLRFILACETASATVFADTVACWPSWNLFSAHGQRVQPQIALELRRDSAAFAGAGTLVSTLGIYKPTLFYALAEGATAISDRYLRLKHAGTPSTPALAPFADFFGELVATQTRSLTTRPVYGSSMQKLRDQVRFRGAAGSTRARLLSTSERRVWQASFQDMDPVDLVQFDELLMRVAGYGENAGVFVLDDSDPRSCIHGIVPEAFEYSESSFMTRDRQLRIVEDPFPSFVS